MERVLYDNGKELGKISEWAQQNSEPVYKTFLGKTVLATPANTGCTFTSPKPVARKSKLTVIEDKKKRYVLEISRIVGGTQVTAKIKEVVEL